MIVGVLCAALLFGLIGLAAHFLWIVAIIIMALGLGYTVANSRRDRSCSFSLTCKAGKPHPAPITARPAPPAQRYGLSDDTWTRAGRELQDLRLLQTEKQLHGRDWDFRRMRNTDWIDKAMLNASIP